MTESEIKEINALLKELEELEGAQQEEAFRS